MSNSDNAQRNISLTRYKICREGWAFQNGEILIRFSTKDDANCTQIIRSGTASDACLYPAQTHAQRVDSCASGGKCTATSSLCFLHMCAAFASSEYRYAQADYEKKPSREEINEAIESISQLSHLRSFFTTLPAFSPQDPKDILWHAVNKSTANLAEQSLANTQIYTLAMLTCSAASIASIPLGIDMKSMKRALVKNAGVSRPGISREAVTKHVRQLIAVTYSNKHNEGLDVLIESALLHRIPLHVLGWGEKYPQPAQKLKATLEFLSSVNRNVVVLFVDAFDSVILRDSREILERFDKQNASMVFGAENACFPMMYPYFNLGYDFCKDATYFPSVAGHDVPLYLNSGQMDRKSWTCA